jgi:hypothetical protein
MLRYIAGLAAALLLVTAGIFLWKTSAQAEDAIPPAPKAREARSIFAQAAEQGERAPSPLRAPAASEKSKEEKRFARADKDDDGRITLAELYEPRRKAFARADANGDGRLSFEEWASSTAEKFAKADSNKDGALTPREYESTKPKPKKAKPKCAC